MVLFLLYFALCSSGLVNAQDNYEVRKIVFKGNKTLKEEFLLERMAVKETSFIEKMLTKKEPSLYNRELLSLDLERLVAIYQSEGFLDINAALGSPDINEKRQTVKIIFDITEGEPVLVDSLQLRLAKDTTNVDIDSLLQKLRPNLLLTRGKRFRDDDLTTDISFIEDAFRNKGYAYVKVDYSLHINLSEPTTHIHYIVDSGPLSYIGETTIDGDKHVSEEFVRKQVSYEEGELYNKSKLSETRQNLYGLQLFQVVSVLAERDSENPENPIPVKIYLEEAPRLTARLGAGYGTEDKFRAFMDLNYRGFLGGVRRINLYLKHSGLEPYSASLRWIQPQFFGNNSSIVLNPFLRRNSEPGYDIQVYGINVPATYRFNPRMISTLTYYFVKTKQFVETGDTLDIKAEGNKRLYDKSGLTLTATFNNASPQFSPTGGFNISFGYKLNGYLFGGDFSYNRLWADFRTYHEAGNVVIAFRAMAGGIRSADSDGFIPVEDRFYSGGSNSVRGWNRAQLGPKRESGTPMGGKSIMETSIEVRYHLFWRIGGVAFLDAGNVWRESFKYKPGDLSYAVGGGLRVETPIGPIRLDLGVPVWNEKKSVQFFISVGEAF